MLTSIAPTHESPHHNRGSLNAARECPKVVDMFRVELSQFPEHRQVSDSPHCLLEHVHGGDETFGKQPPQAVNVRVTNYDSLL